MPTLVRRRATTARGISYDVTGTGEPVVLLAPAATRSEVWHNHQVPALVALGYTVVAVETRGCAPSVAPPGPYRLDDLVADAAEVITDLRAGAVRVVGASLGAMVGQELCLARPDLVRSAVLLGTRGRADHFRRTAALAWARRIGSAGPPAPEEAGFEAVALLAQLFSARTLADDAAVRDWLTLLTRFPLRGAGPAAQYELAAGYGAADDRLAALRAVRTPCLVVGFEHDAVTPPGGCRAVAAALPSADYAEIPDCGHFGFLERPDLVNATLAGFLRR